MGRGESCGPFFAPCGRCRARVIIQGMAEILLITSDEEMAGLIRDRLIHRHLKLRVEPDTASAVMALSVRKFPLIILDADDTDGGTVQAVEAVRQQSNSPIFIIMADTAEQDVITVLDAGADDVFPRPVRAGELAAKVCAALRLRKSYGIDDVKENPHIEAREIYVDLEQKRVWVRGKEKRFTRREYELLVFLMRHPDQVFTKQELYRRVWDEEVVGDIATVTVHIKKLRDMIEEKPAYPTIIGTDWGVGYVFLGEAPAW